MVRFSTQELEAEWEHEAVLTAWGGFRHGARTAVLERFMVLPHFDAEEDAADDVLEDAKLYLCQSCEEWEHMPGIPFCGRCRDQARDIADLFGDDDDDEGDDDVRFDV